MKRLLMGIVGASALGAGVANAQLSQDETMARLDGATFSGYRVEAEDCPFNACNARSVTNLSEARSFLAGALANGFFEPAPEDDNGKQIERRRASIQEVFLNFDAGGDPFFFVDVVFLDGTTGFLTLPDFFYTPENRDAVMAGIEADFEDFQFHFFPEDPGNGEFTTLNIGDNDRALGSTNITLIEVAPGSFSFSILFGVADEIDFGNVNNASAAFVDASFWVLLRDFFPAALGPLSGIPVADPTDPVELAAVTEQAVIQQTINTGTHEIAHTLGLRHHDSFGAPGDGLPTTGVPGPDDFVPVFPGPSDAGETILHIMATGASVALPIQNSSSVDRFFSERAAIKLAINERGRFFDEDFFNRRNAKKSVRLLPLRVPNTIVEGVNAGSRFLDVKQAVIEGRISEEGEIDRYHFRGRRGEFMNLEQVSFTDFTLEDTLFFSELRVFKKERDGSETLVTSNFLPAESIDPLI
ncbi:MAG: hypothetical protein AAGJ87_07045, partial [Pseudomonadota bacterium]